MLTTSALQFKVYPSGRLSPCKLCMSPTATPNYADLVLQEAAAEEATRQLKSSGRQTAKELTASVVQLNLADEEKFPALGNAVKKSSVAWGSSINESKVPFKPTLSAPKAAPSASSIISSSFQLPAEQQRRSIASISLPECLQRVMKQTETVVEASTSGQSRAISFVIRGRGEKVSLAKRMLWSELAQNGSIEFEVPQEALKYIIGPGGKTLQGLQHDLAVKITIPKDWQGTLTVTGDFEGVALARDRILQIVSERVGREAVQLEMEGPLARFLWMSSVSGLTESGVKEQFPGVKFTLHRSFYTSSPSHLSLSGNRDQIAQLKPLLEAAIAHLSKVLKCASTPIPKALHRLICGGKMANLIEFEIQSHCALSLPPADDESETVSICAPEQFLMTGLTALMKFTKTVAYKDLSVSSLETNLLLTRSAKHRAELKQIEKETGAGVLFVAERQSIGIDGSKEAVDAAFTAVSLLLADLTARFPASEQMTLDKAHLKHVIGKKGHVLQQIQKDFAVELLVDDADDGEVLILGRPEGINGAKTYISKLIASVADLITCSAKIDHKFHAMLIGSKGANLASYQERFPSVFVNFPQDASSNVVEFRGVKEEVEAFRTELVAQAEAIRHEQIMNSYVQEISNLRLRSTQDRAHLLNFARLQQVKLSFSEDKPGWAQVQGNKKAVDRAVPLIEAEEALLADRDSLSFAVEPQFHSILIGKGGRNLKHLHSKYGVNFKFPQAEPSSAADIQAIGPKANLSKARDELLDLLKFHLENNHQESLPVPAQFLGFVLGKGGSRLTGIEVSTDCRINFDRQGEEAKFTLFGSEEAIKAAKSEIESIIREQEKIKEVSVECPKELFSCYNFAFKRLTSTHASCQFFSHSSKVNIRGEVEAVEVASTALLNLVTELSSFKTASVPDIPSTLFGKLLGRGGENVKKMSAEHGVDIRVPRTGQPGAVQVSGPSAAVDVVIESIQKLI